MRRRPLASPSRRRVLRSGLALLGGLGCAQREGYLDLPFELPARSFAVSAQDPRWRSPPAAFANAIACAEPGDCCGPEALPPAECGSLSLRCQQGACATVFAFEVARTVDLGREVPALAQRRGLVLADLTLETVRYSASSQINLALPPITLYVAPAGTTSASGPQSPARALVTIPMTASGVQSSEELVVPPEGRAAFAALARDFQTPFALIAATSIVLRSGSAVPQGRFELWISGSALARL